MGKSSYLYENIYRALAEEIQNGTRQPGDKMPTEYELAQTYQVSRITSKRALNQLAEEGLVVRHRGLGTFVAEDNAMMTQNAPLPSFDKSAKTRVGIIMEDLGESYSLGLYYAIAKRAEDAGIQLCLGLSYGDQKKEREVLRELLALEPSGLLVMPAHGPFYDTDLLRLVLAHFPVVLLDRPLAGIPAPSVSSDNRSAAAQLTEHLISKGHRDICFATTALDEALSLEERYRGYTDTMRAASLVERPPLIMPELIRFSHYNLQERRSLNGQSILTDFLREHPNITALIGSEYGVAHLARIAASEIGLCVPDDLALCCFDEKYGYLGEYSFTHIKQDEDAMAKTAIEILLSMLAGKNMRRQSRLIPTVLMEGPSS